MKIRVVDFETSDMVGKGRPVGIVQAGWTDLFDDGRITRPKGLLVNPGLPIVPEARGVHHISDDMLIGAPSPSEACLALMEGMVSGDMFAAHHAKFERELFAGGPFPWICTMVCAKHLLEEAPGFSNQTLRYWLGIDVEFEWPDLAMPPHRAPPDTYVTAHILKRLISLRTPHELVQLTVTPVLLKEVPFENHAGKLWSEMDRGFLEWVLAPGKRTPMKPEVLHTARHWLNRLNSAGGPFA